MTVEYYLLDDDRCNEAAMSVLSPKVVADREGVWRIMRDQPAKRGAIFLGYHDGMLQALLSTMVEAHGKRRGTLVVLTACKNVSIYEPCFERVLGGFDAVLPPEELAAVLRSPSAGDRCVALVVTDGFVSLWRGDLTLIVVPKTDFAPTPVASPDYTDIEVTDYGRTLRFGKYEAAFDAVLYERDADFRRRLLALRLAKEKSFGASLRRLRLQRGKRREDIQGVSPKEITRLETGQVKKPHSDTVQKIAKALGVAPDEIETF